MTKEEAAEWCESVHAEINMSENLSIGYLPWVSVRVRRNTTDRLDLFTLAHTFIKAVQQLKAAYDALIAERERQQVEYQQQMDEERSRRQREREAQSTGS